MYIIYLRKSRLDSGAAVSEVLARHERILQNYAKSNFGCEIQENCIYREIVSGETIKDRPVIQAVLNRIQAEDVEGVLVVDPQRLSRGDLSDCGTIIRAFRYTNTLIITPTKTYDLSEKFDRKFFESELMRGNDYLEYVKEVLLRGRLASVSEGNFIGSVPPYGYDKVMVDKKPTLVINSAEAAEQDAEREKLGTKWQDYDRLFVKWDGRPMNNNTPYFWLKEFCEENNFRFCDIHSLRHFYASALINEGVDADTVSGALGHSTITTTTSIYCHVFNQAQARAGKDSPKLYKGQVKDRSRIRVKEKLSNGDISSFESLVCGDPYGN